MKFKVPDFPRFPEKGHHIIHLTKEIYVDKEDVRKADSKEFWGIAPNKIIGLKYAGSFLVKEVVSDDKGEITHVNIELL